MRTIGVGVGADDRDQTLLDLGLEEAAQPVERARLRRRRAAAAAAAPDAARTICGMCAGGRRQHARVKLVGGRLRPIENQTNSPATHGQPGAARDPDRHSAARSADRARRRPCQCGDSSAFAAVALRAR